MKIHSEIELNSFPIVRFSLLYMRFLIKFAQISKSERIGQFFMLFWMQIIITLYDVRQLDFPGQSFKVCKHFIFLTCTKRTNTYKHSHFARASDRISIGSWKILSTFFHFSFIISFFFHKLATLIIIQSLKISFW